MGKQSGFIQDSQSKAIANVQRQQMETSAGTRVTDNRSEAITQRKLQDLVNISTQATQLKSLPIQKQSDLEEEKPVQGKFETVQRVDLEEEKPIQGKFTQPSSPIQRQEEATNNTGLPNQLKAGIESLGGMTMDHVKVHYNSDKPAQLNAHAYAQGSDIHIAPGQEKHLPHEAWHVVQQAQGRVKPTMQMKQGVPVNDDAGLEHEADVMGAKALQMRERGNQSPGYNIVVQKKRSNNRQGNFIDTGSNTAQLVRAKKALIETEEEYAKGVDIYNAQIVKGKKAWEMLQAVLANKESLDVNTKVAFVERYGVTHAKDDTVPSPASSRVKDDGSYLSLDTGKKGAKETAYQNVINTVKGVIVGGSNYASKDSGEGRLSNSEILYHQYKMAMEINAREKNSEAGDLGNLNKIVRNSIQGVEAITVLGMCEMNVGQRVQGKTFATGTDDFFAILGTDNGKSAAFLLKDHPNEIGWKNITNIVASNSWIEINIA